MVEMKAAVFCHNALGDGVLTLVLSNNLHLNGWKVDTYHDLMGQMEGWFPHLPIVRYPSLEELPRVLNGYDLFLVIHNDANPFTLRLVEEGKRRFPEKMKVFYVYPSKNMVNEPYYRDVELDPGLPVAESFRVFCEKKLHLTKSTRSNGFIPPVNLVGRREEKRVIFHVSSSRAGKNWPKEKFLQLARLVEAIGFEPHILTSMDKEEWERSGYPVVEFHELDCLARFVYESGYCIGNDSGVGHLASFLGVPTLTFSRRRALARLWRPSYAPGVVLTPPFWIPNFSGFRLRDQYWKKLISVRRALKGFEELLQLK
jgi:ADP-heptose:LPS heptosyltransferase